MVGDCGGRFGRLADGSVSGPGGIASAGAPRTDQCHRSSTGRRLLLQSFASGAAANAANAATAAAAAACCLPADGVLPTGPADPVRTRTSHYRVTVPHDDATGANVPESGTVFTGRIPRACCLLPKDAAPAIAAPAGTHADLPRSAAAGLPDADDAEAAILAADAPVHAAAVPPVEPRSATAGAAKVCRAGVLPATGSTSGIPAAGIIQSAEISTTPVSLLTSKCS